MDIMKYVKIYFAVRALYSDKLTKKELELELEKEMAKRSQSKFESKNSLLSVVIFQTAAHKQYEL